MSTRCYAVYPDCPSTHCDSPIDHDGPHETPNGKNRFESEEHATRAYLRLREDLAFTRGRLAKTENALVRAERERDEAQRHAAWWKERTRASINRVRALRAAPRHERAKQRRALTAEDITAGVIGRALDTLDDGGNPFFASVAEARQVLTYVLTRPQRPEGAEEIEAILADSPLDPEPVRRELAKHLAERGVRVTAEGQR